MIFTTVSSFDQSDSSAPSDYDGVVTDDDQDEWQTPGAGLFSHNDWHGIELSSSESETEHNSDESRD
jgi:hypothetical protein